MNRQRYCPFLMTHCPYDNSTTDIECNYCMYNSDKNKQLEDDFYYGGRYSNNLQ